MSTTSTNFEFSEKPYIWLIVGAVALIIFVALLYNNSGEPEFKSNTVSTQPSSIATPTLMGRVKDQLGAGVPNALVTITFAGARQTVTASADGTYVYYGQLPAQFTIETSLPAKNVWTPKQTVRATGRTTKLDITMRIPNQP